ncbi:MAG: hypothetical protein AAGB30_11250 [Pedobacter sp.]|nr:hypothetical protein [Pedobacter sp.]
MKFKLLAVLLFYFSFTTIAQKPAKMGTSKYLDEKRGFKNIILNSDISSIEKDIVETKDTTMGIMPGVKFFEIINSEMKKIGDKAEIKKIIVGSFNGKIAIISMTLDKPNGSIMNETFKEAYGSGYKPNQFMEKWIWSSKNVMLVLDIDGLRVDTILMADRPLWAEIEKYGKEAAKKSVKDI